MAIFSLETVWEPSTEASLEIEIQARALVDFIETIAEKESEGASKEVCVAHIAHKAITTEIERRRHDRLISYHNNRSNKSTLE